MNTIQQVRFQFNSPVITPDGPGYLVAKDRDGNLLVSVKQKPDKTHSRCRHAFYKPADVKEAE